MNIIANLLNEILSKLIMTIVLFIKYKLILRKDN
jgi:hypothetical protein